MNSKLLYAAVASLMFLISCSNEEKITILLPKGYVGWVNIVFDKQYDNKIFEFSDGKVIIVNKNPYMYKVNAKNLEFKPTKIDYYFYNQDTLYKVKSDCISFQSSKELQRFTGNKRGKKYETFSFYVSCHSVKDSIMDSIDASIILDSLEKETN